MKITFCATFVLLASGIIPTSALTYQEKISSFDADDFVFKLGGPEPDAVVDGVELRSASVKQFPVLEGQGLSVTIVNLGPCAINHPYVRPRATEMLYMIEGDNLRVGFVEEFGGNRSVVNDLSKGDVFFVPQGLVQYQQNLGCDPVTFLVSLNSEDPGVVPVFTLVRDLPSDLIKALLNVDDRTLSALLKSLPTQPGLARQRCLKRCRP